MSKNKSLQGYKISKGEYGYIRESRKKTILRTILFFGLSIAIYFTGYITTGTSKNLLTVVAVLGCLPASKSAVNMIMFLKEKECTESAYTQINKAATGLKGYYDMIFTTYEKTFQITHIMNTGKLVIGFSEDPKCDTAKCEAHILQMLKQNGMKEYTVKIFSQLDKYCERLEQISGLEEHAENTGVTELIMQITL